MKTESRELLKKIMNHEEVQADRIELGTLMLQLYEHVEEDLIKKHGIHIQLNLFEGVDACIYGNRLGIWLCLETILYSFVEDCPDNSKIEFAMKNKDNRIWVIFSRMKVRGEIKKENHEKSVDSIVKEYLDSQEILLRSMKEPEVKVAIGFCERR